jgi:hypothetical protein
MLYTIEETFSYEVCADTVEQALDQFQAYMETGDELTTDARFVDNSTTVYDDNGREVQ